MALITGEEVFSTVADHHQFADVVQPKVQAQFLIACEPAFYVRCDVNGLAAIRSLPLANHHRDAVGGLAFGKCKGKPGAVAEFTRQRARALGEYELPQGVRNTVKKLPYTVRIGQGEYAMPSIPMLRRIEGFRKYADTVGACSLKETHRGI